MNIFIKRSEVDRIKRERQEALEKAKEEIWHEHLDSYSCRKVRKELEGTWTPEDGAMYQQQLEKCRKLISELPPIIPDNVVILSDEEYEKKEKALQEKMEAEYREASRILPVTGPDIESSDM